MHTIIDQDNNIINTNDPVGSYVKTKPKLSKKQQVLLAISLFVFIGAVTFIIKEIFDHISSQTKSYGYPTFQEINEKMNFIKESLSEIRNVSIITLGYSVEHNPIKSIQISPINELKINNSCEQFPIGKFCF